MNSVIWSINQLIASGSFSWLPCLLDFLSSSWSACLLRVVVQKGEAAFPPASLPVNSLWACDVTKINGEEPYSQLLGTATEWNVKFAFAAVLCKTGSHWIMRAFAFYTFVVFNPYWFPNDKVGCVGSGELGCHVGRSLAWEQQPRPSSIECLVSQF